MNRTEATELLAAYAASTTSGTIGDHLAMQARIIDAMTYAAPEPTTYNGWTNYATWRVNLELADGIIESMQDDAEDDPERRYADTYDLGKAVEEAVDEALTDYGQIEDGIALNYARSFVSDVDWREIAEHAAADYPHLLASDDDESDDEDDAA